MAGPLDGTEVVDTFTGGEAVDTTDAELADTDAGREPEVAGTDILGTADEWELKLAEAVGLLLEMLMPVVAASTKGKGKSVITAIQARMAGGRSGAS